MPQLTPVKLSQINKAPTVVKSGLTPVKLSSIQGLDQNFATQDFIQQMKVEADNEKKIRDFQPEYFNGLNDDEERIINEMQVRGKWTKEEAEYAKKVMRGETDDYKEQIKNDRASSAFGYFLGPVYYFDPNNKGLPKILKNGEKVPDNASLESFWGANKLAFEAASGVKLKSKIDAENDNFLTTSLKQITNHFLDILEVPGSISSALESGITGQHGFFEDERKQVDNFLEQIRLSTSSASKVPVLTDKFKDFSDFFNSESYNITSQNLASLLGSAIGSLLEFGSVGKVMSGVSKGLLGVEKLSAVQRIASGYSAGVMVNLGQTLSDAEKGKVTPREAALMGIGNAMIYSVIEQIGGGPEARFLRGMEEGGFRKMSQTLLRTIKDNGGVINPEVLKKAFTATLEVGIKEIPKARTIGADIFKEAGEETLQEMESRGSEQLFNALAGYNAYKGTFGDTEHLKGYFENALGGALGGGFGGAFSVATGHKEYDEKDATIYDYVRAGKTTELKQELMNMQTAKKITTQDVKNYSTLIDAYDGYYKQLSNKNLAREDAAKVFENAFNIEHLHGEIEKIESQPTISPIQKGEVDVLRNKANEYQKEINAILKGEKTFVEKPVTTETSGTKTEEPTEKEAVEEKPVNIHEIKPKTFNGMKPSEKKANIVSHLKTQQTPIVGTVSKKTGSVTSFQFTDESGKELTFYNHPTDKHEKISKTDLGKPATLQLVPESKNDKGEVFKDVVQVKIGDKVVGNVQETDFAKSVKSATESEIPEVPLPTEEPPVSESAQSQEEFIPETFKATAEEKAIEKQGIPTGVELSKKAKQKLGKLGFSTPMVEAMSREDAETAKTFTSKEDAKEMVDKYAKIVAKKHGEEIDFERPVTTEQKKKTVPKTRKSVKELIRDPESLEEAIVQALLTTRMKTEDLIRHTGFGKKNERTGKTHGLTEFRKLIWAHKKNGVPLDQFSELMPEHLTEGLGAMDLQNKILEILQDNPSKSKLIEKLQELQKEKVQEISPEDIDKYIEDEKVYQELKGQELETILPPDEVIMDLDDKLSDKQKKEVDDFIAKHTDENGVTDWDAIQKALDSNEVFDLPQGTTQYIDNLIQQENDGRTKKDQEESTTDVDGTQEEEPPSDEDELKYQSSKVGQADELLATDNPRLSKFVRQHLAKLFPKVQVFEDAESFQKFLDKNYPGKKLDLTKLGATIGNTVYINPDSAVQSTDLHEHAHIYWDMLPDEMPIKENLFKLFGGNEEDVITAIGQAGVDIAKVKLDGGKLARFKSLLKTFWAKVKNVIGIANKKDLARIMADDIWNNAHRIQANEDEGNETLKFMSAKANENQEDVVRQLQSFADYLQFNEDDHTYFNKQGDVQYSSVTDVLDKEPKYKFEGFNTEEAKTRGKAIDGIVNSIIQGTSPYEEVAKYGVTMSPEVIDDLVEQFKPFIEGLKKQGEVLSQAMLANNSYKMAGRTDIIVVKKDGTIDVYDVKSSKTPTNKPGYSKSTIHKGKEKASKKDLHGVQMAMYGYLLEAPDMLFGQTGKKIGKLVVVPVHLKADGLEITDATLEPVIESDYQEYKDEAERIIDKQLQENINEDEVLNTEMEALTQEQYFDKAITYINDERLTLAQALKKSKNKAEDKAKYIQQYKDYAKQLKEAKQITINIETATAEQLADIYNLIHGYDNLVQNLYLDEVSRRMRERLVEDQKKRTGVKEESERPFTRTEAYFTRPSKVTEEHPYIQAVAREKLLADEDAHEELNKIKKDFKKYSDALKKEKRKGESIGTKVLRGISSSLEDKTKYFKNLVKKQDGKLRLKNYRNAEDAKGLSESEFNYLKHYTDVMEKMYKDVNAKEQITDGFFPQLSPTFFETAFDSGFMKAVSDYFYNDRLEDVVLNYKDVDGNKKFMRYEEVVDTINQQADDGIIDKATKVVRLRNVRERAEAAMKNRRGEDGKKIVRSETSHRLLANGKLVPRVLSEKEEGQPISLDLDRAFTAYIEDMVNVKYMNKVIPFAMGLWNYYKDKPDQEFTKKFVKAFVWGDIVGQKQETTDRFTKAVRFAQMWTYLNVMTFNVPAALLNISQGVSQLIKNELFVSGTKRFFTDLKKARAIIEKYHIVSVEHTDIFESGAGLFTYLANGANTLAETYLQGAGFIGQLTKEQWDNFNADGTVKDENLLPSKEDVQKMKSVKNDMMGAYDRGDKRMYKHWALGSAAMQFKGWMPDWIEDRLQSANTDVFGTKKKGSWRSLRYAIDHLGLMVSSKEFWTSNDPDIKANRGHLKNAVYVALLLAMATGASDDDKDKQLSMRLWRAVNDMSGVFNLSTMDFITTQPLPFLGTVHNFLNALKSIPDTYDKSGRYGDKGEWMFPGKIMNVMPYNHLRKELFSPSAYK